MSLLGRVQDGEPRSLLRSGIYRVVEQTVRRVSAVPGVQLALGAQTYWEPALEYVETHPELRRLRFPVAGRVRFGLRLRKQAIAAHDRAGARPTGALPVRVASRVAGDANRALDVLVHKIGRSTHARADVFHSPFYALPDAAQRARRVRYFLTVHDLIPQLLPQLLPEAVASSGGDGFIRGVLGSIRPEDHVLAVSEHTRRDLLNAYPAVTPEHVRVTPLAADPERFYPCDDADRVAAVRAKYGVPDAPYILTVGTLAPHKNIPRLIRAFADLVRAERLDDLHLVLTGAKGWGYEPIFEELDRLDHVADRVVLTGYVDDEDLAPLYSGALAFVYPSLYEGFGLPPLEAMQCGTPVITGNRASLPEVVGDAGLMVDPYDQDALAQAILDVYRSGETRRELARRALARAREFTWARYADRTVAAYRAAL
ncbi:hypothetical protein tb265_43460 [Gemmatimonadetes bacterium T265]|nr:hypothetical protein tb265_43460 [Gemmatimonadetes bacterium T265]